MDMDDWAAMDAPWDPKCCVVCTLTHPVYMGPLHDLWEAMKDLVEPCSRTSLSLVQLWNEASEASSFRVVKHKSHNGACVAWNGQTHQPVKGSRYYDPNNRTYEIVWHLIGLVAAHHLRTSGSESAVHIHCTNLIKAREDCLRRWPRDPHTHRGRELVGDLLEFALAEGYEKANTHRHIMDDISAVVALVTGIREHLTNSDVPFGYVAPANLDSRTFAKALVLARAWHKNKCKADDQAEGSAFVAFAKSAKMIYTPVNRPSRPCPK